MSGIVERLRARVSREKFDPRLVGLVGNPFYLIRRPLHDHIARLSTRVRGRVLDFGCGSKPYRHLFAHTDEYIGLDIEQSGHDHKNSQVDVFYDGNAIPLPNASFDAVVAFEVFEHVFNLNEVLGEIRRVLRPDGQLLVSLPFAWDEHEQPYDFGRYTSFGLRHVLEQGGFEVLEMAKSGNYVSAVWQLWVAYLHQRLSPRAKPLKVAFQFAVVFPTTLAGLIASKVLPRSDQLYSNLVVLARNREDSGSL
ncbi:MAG TPA: class I SAM-dependent methyltransferase [Sphingomicrobium sp.]|jgi:SAM-dependent methyltransferase